MVDTVCWALTQLIWLVHVWPPGSIHSQSRPECSDLRSEILELAMPQHRDQVFVCPIGTFYSFIGTFFYRLSSLMHLVFRIHQHQALEDAKKDLKEARTYIQDAEAEEKIDFGASNGFLPIKGTCVEAKHDKYQVRKCIHIITPPLLPSIFSPKT